MDRKHSAGNRRRSNGAAFGVRWELSLGLLGIQFVERIGVNLNRADGMNLAVSAANMERVEEPSQCTRADMPTEVCSDRCTDERSTMRPSVPLRRRNREERSKKQRRFGSAKGRLSQNAQARVIVAVDASSIMHTSRQGNKFLI